MKKIYKYIILFVIAVALFATGCSGFRKLDGSEFIQRAKQIETVDSFCWTQYIGVSNSRAYLEYGQMPFIGDSVRTIVYWTPLSELPDNLVKELKAGKPPWPEKSKGKQFDKSKIINKE